jgi:hypothetical protein
LQNRGGKVLRVDVRNVGEWFFQLLPTSEIGRRIAAVADKMALLASVASESMTMKAVAQVLPSRL